MNATELILTHVCSAAVIGIMLLICLRSGSGAGVTTATGRQVYRVHRAWYIFSAVAGVFLVAIFAFASTTARPEDRLSAFVCSAIAAILFVFFAFFLRSLKVTVDDTTLTSHVLWVDQSVALQTVERVQLVGLVVEVKLKPDPAAGKRQRALTFLPAFRGLGELLATIRRRAGSNQP